ncbi:MAG TPA: DUF2147 domain-containing protein [Hydrogenophaga sp.]|nr:DUF2147 domain-containing protein [Hydrogenophaga sp.]
MTSNLKLKMRLATTCLVTLGTLGAAPSARAGQTNEASAPLGRWITESGNLEVEVAPCGDALCGKVVKVMANRSMSNTGQEMAATDTRAALGMTILSGFRDNGGGAFKGALYNRENAKTYTATITPAEPDQLIVHAYVGIPLFGKTQVWRRPSPSLPAPSTAPAAATPGAQQ